MSKPTIIVGPPTAKVSRQQAEEKLIAHPLFPKDAEYTLDETEGRWIAAIVQSAPPAFLDGGGAGETPDGPPSPAIPPDGPPTPDGPEPPSDDEGSNEKPEGEDGEKGEKKGLEADVKHLTELVTKLVDALGLGDQGPEDSPVPDADGPPGPPPGEGPGPDGSGDSKTHTVHERALKPGEAPPGTTPVGAPSFASVRADHPWKDILGKKRTFKLEEPISRTETLASIHNELQSLAAETGSYKIEQLTEGTVNGQRVARCLVVAK